MTTAGTVAREQWEARLRMRYGSRAMKQFSTRKAAEQFAYDEIRAAGVGCVYYISEQTRTVYYDTSPDDDD